MSIFQSSSIGNFTRGGQTAIHFIRMIAQVMSKFIVLAVITFVVAAGSIFWATTEPYDRYMTVKWMIAQVIVKGLKRTDGSLPLILPDGGFEVIGIRPSEKLHEVMIPYEESRNCIDMGDYYVLQPAHHWWNLSRFLENVRAIGTAIETPFEYASNSNGWWLTRDELKSLVDSVPAPVPAP